MNMDEEWIPLTTFVVKYPKDDHFGKFLAFVSLMPIILMISYATLCLMVRDIRIIFMCIGQLIDICLCLFLKKIIKQPRPVGYDQINLKIYGKHDMGYGMPSQHSEFQAYFTVFTILYLHTLRSKESYRTFFHFLKLFLIGVCAIVVYSRIYLVYHTWSQCFVGLAIGSLWAVVWFTFGQMVFEKYLYKKIMSWKISKQLHLTYDPNLTKINGD